MWGAPRERWSHALFDRLLPDLSKTTLPDVQYWPSSAHGGEFPHQIDVGTVSYYGVGAYLRPLTDARRAAPRFATECLALANVSDDAPDSSAGPYPRVHSPRNKARVPRDLGAGWDFDDVRDHYLREIFRIDPLALRYAEHERYLMLSRVVSGEVMAAAFKEWRRRDSRCGGALIWFLRDLWFGSGWGVIDALGKPKAPYFFLKRLLQPRCLFLTDEGGSGVYAHVVNETGEPFKALLEVALFRDSQVCIGTRRREIVVPPRGSLETTVSGLFEGFIDVSYAYRFGPPPCDVVYATLTDERGTVIARDFHFPTGHHTTLEADLGLTAHARTTPDGAEVLLRATRAARFVQLDVPDFLAADQYFHLAPGIEHRVSLQRSHAGATLKGEARASNSTSASRLLVSE
jgi:beta-mannosidase